ncbi:MAG: sporulation transcriptional regulator SpoIIID [Clostridia bacterium]
MIYDYEDRAIRLAVYMIENNSTVRQTAKEFGISKSTVHKDLSVRLKEMSKPLYSEVKVLLETNKRERHIRGGQATRLKYLKLTKNNIC